VVGLRFQQTILFQRPFRLLSPDFAVGLLTASCVNPFVTATENGAQFLILIS
jgi:hypothetical protein